MNSTDLLPQLQNLNRTLVTRDALTVMEKVDEHIPLKLHKYPSGSDYQTWPIPLEWNVVKAELRDGDNVIASYSECPLFVAIYSAGFKGYVSYDELVKHTFTKPEHPDAFNYEHRIAGDHRQRLNNWRIAMPYNRLMALDKTKHYYVDIQIETKPGNMLVGEHILKGELENSFYFLSHYCHPGQINDGIAGVVTGVEVMKRLRQRNPNPKFTYRFLALPETFGSAVYCANNFTDLDNAIGAVFTEMPGARANLQMIHSRRGDVYIDRIFRYVLKKYSNEVRIKPFRNGWGNDELMFDSPGVGVPAISLDRYPFPQYHTHHDDMSNFCSEKLEEVVKLFIEAIDLIERDFIPQAINRLPVYLTRHDLYSDWTWERQQYDMNQKVIDNLFSGKSIVDIALENDLDVEFALQYANKFVEKELILRKSIDSNYARNIRFLPPFCKD